MLRVEGLDQVRSWCALHDPKEVEQSQDRLEAIAAYMDVADAIGGVSKPVVSTATGTGDDFAGAVAKDNEVKSLLPNSGQQLSLQGYNNLLQKFQSSPTTGCTTVLDMARVKAGFNPLIPVEKGNLQAYYDYVQRVVRAPFFHLGYSNTIELRERTKDYNKLIDKIVNVFEGISAQDKKKVKDSLVRLAQAATSRAETRSSESLFVQSTLEVSNEIYVYIYYSTIAFEMRQGKSTVKQSDFTLARTRLSFYTDLWPSYAEQVMNRHVKLVSEWLDENTTKPGGPPQQNFCLDEVPSVLEEMAIGT